MALVFMLLLSGALGEVLDPAHEVFFSTVGGSVQMPCRSTLNQTRETAKVLWYWRTWRGANWLTQKVCAKKDNEKLDCRVEDIHRVKLNHLKMEDSGTYYCTYLESRSLHFDNGVVLVVEDTSSHSSDVHLLAPLQPTPLNTTIQLACVIHTTLRTVHMAWDVSGIPYKGRMVLVEHPNNTRTFLNLLSLSTWNYGDNVTCDVWFRSSPVQIMWRIPERGLVSGWLGPSCSGWLISAVSFALLLLLLISLHLMWITKKMAKTRDTKKHSKSVQDEDEIVYTELKMHSKRQSQK